jgi:hypothetical protein
VCCKACTAAERRDAWYSAGACQIQSTAESSRNAGRAVVALFQIRTRGARPRRRGPQEHRQRPAHDAERRSEEKKELVLEHVRREESLADGVHRRHERDGEHGPAHDERACLPDVDSLSRPGALPEASQAPRIEPGSDCETEEQERIQRPALRFE